MNKTIILIIGICMLMLVGCTITIENEALFCVSLDSHELGNNFEITINKVENPENFTQEVMCNKLGESFFDLCSFNIKCEAGYNSNICNCQHTMKIIEVFHNE